MKKKIPLDLSNCLRESPEAHKVLLDVVWKFHSEEIILKVKEGFWYSLLASEWEDVLLKDAPIKFSHQVPSGESLPIPTVRLTPYELALFTDPRPLRVGQVPSFGPYVDPTYSIEFTDRHYAVFKRSDKGENYFPSIKQDQLVDPREVSRRFREVFDALQEPQ